MALGEKLLPLADRISAAVERGLSPAQREDLAEGLNKLIANLGRFDAARPRSRTRGGTVAG